MALSGKRKAILLRTMSLLCLSFVLHFPTYGQDAPISARVTTNHVRPDQTFELEVTVAPPAGSKTDRLEFPKLDDFEVISSQVGSMTSAAFQNGSFTLTPTETRQYLLKPKKEGVFTIGPARMTVDGKMVSTAPIKVTVDKKAPEVAEEDEWLQDMKARVQGLRRNQPQSPTPQEEAVEEEDPLGGEEVPRGSFFIRAHPTKKTVYKGERLEVSYVVYIEQSAHVQQVDFLQLPSLKGFWKEDLFQARDPQQLQWETQMLGGKMYRRAVLARYALYPLGEGKKTIDSLKLNVYLVDRAMTNPFFMTPRVRPFPRASREEKIEVLPLPNINVPPEFSGAVGTFSVKSSVAPASVNANSAFSYFLTIDGSGNFNAIERLTPTLPEGFELFDTKTEASNTQKKFEFIVIPRKPGTVTLPAPKLAFFDPKTQRYHVVAAEPQTVTVTGQASASTPPVLEGAGTPPGGAVETPAEPSTPPLITQLPPSWLVQAQRLGPWTTGFLWMAWIFFYGWKVLQRRRKQSTQAETKSLQGLLKDWKNRYATEPPSAAATQEMKTAVLKAVLAKKGLRFSKEELFRPVDDLLLNAAQSGLPSNVVERARNALGLLDQLGFSSPQSSERLIRWNSALNEIQSLAKTLHES